MKRKYGELSVCCLCYYCCCLELLSSFNVRSTYLVPNTSTRARVSNSHSYGTAFYYCMMFFEFSESDFFFAIWLRFLRNFTCGSRTIQLRSRKWNGKNAFAMASDIQLRRFGERRLPIGSDHYLKSQICSRLN